MARFSIPWLLLVSPRAGWLAVREFGSSVWPAFAAQAILLFVGWVAAARPMGELADTAAFTTESSAPAGALAVASLILGLTALLALLLFFLLKAIGNASRYFEVLAWLIYGLTPLYVGRCLGLLSFAIFQPLARDPQEAIALQVNPLGLSLAGQFEPLSLAWTFAAALDVFAIWALVLLASGALHYLRLGAARSGALVGALLLIWLLALTAAWQGLQRSL